MYLTCKERINKLGIYSTYSAQSSINFLARCSTFSKPLKKFRILSVQRGSRGSNEVLVRRKIPIFNFFNPVNRWYLEKARYHEQEGRSWNGKPGKPVSSVLELFGEPGNFRARTKFPSRISRGDFLSKYSSIAQAGISNTQC